MRGKEIHLGEIDLQDRITPAYAGKRPRFSGSLRPTGDHPRVCGEKLFDNPKIDNSQGSPPRMRGKVPEAPLSRLQIGITPAYAGKSACRCFCNVVYGDHPRVCGEKGIANLSVNSMPGSPPRMRGKGLRKQLSSARPGITPAYAGKRAGLALLLPRAGDHPRVCGEKGIIYRGETIQGGSPPRMRGKGLRTRCADLTAGITPAYAGKRH